MGLPTVPLRRHALEPTLLELVMLRRPALRTSQLLSNSSVIRNARLSSPLRLNWMALSLMVHSRLPPSHLPPFHLVSSPTDHALPMVTRPTSGSNTPMPRPSAPPLSLRPLQLLPPSTESRPSVTCASTKIHFLTSDLRMISMLAPGFILNNDSQYLHPRIIKFWL